VWAGDDAGNNVHFSLRSEDPRGKYGSLADPIDFGPTAFHGPLRQASGVCGSLPIKYGFISTNEQHNTDTGRLLNASSIVFERSLSLAFQEHSGRLAIEGQGLPSHMPPLLGQTPTMLGWRSGVGSKADEEQRHAGQGGGQPEPEKHLCE
jgi:hypothetical protein